MLGKVIAGRFRIVRLIGEGGMGSVYEATHDTLPRKFAIKILRPDLARDERFHERFRREAIAASSIEHPNVIYITDFGQTDTGSLYLVMEYLEGTGLDELIGRQVRLPVNRIMPILIQVADALHHAHEKGVIHRDLKPENILLTEVRGQKDFVKVLDFGIAKLKAPEYDNVVLTMKGQVFGTAEYMSPEQAAGDPIDGRSDLYAVGCLAYEMLIGDPPFLGSAMDVLRAQVREHPLPPSMKLKKHRIPPALDALVLRCLAKDPNDRYQSGAELRRDLMKVRALMLGFTDEFMGRSRRRGTSFGEFNKKKTEGWHDLGGQVPELFSSSEMEELASEHPVTSTTIHPQTSAPENLREEYQDALRELAMALVEAVLAPSETSESLERLLVVEEEIASLTGTIALTEQNFDRIRYEYSQREKRLRYAILDLSMEQAKLEGLSAVDQTASEAYQAQIEDLVYQIGELSRRCQELEQERADQIRELDLEVKAFRHKRSELEREVAEIFQSLHAQIETLRPVAITEELVSQYDKLDTLRISLERARKTTK